MVKIIKKIGPAGEIPATNNEMVVSENEMGLEKPKTKLTMMQKFIILTVINHDFVKGNADEFANQLDQFSNSLIGSGGPTALAIKYGYTTADLEEIKNDAAYWRYWCTKHGAGMVYMKAWTDKGIEIRKGTGSSVTAWPVGTEITSPPTDVLPGVETRFREKARKAKSQTRIYTTGDGNAMCIEVISSTFVPADGQPVLNISITGGGHTLIEYIKSKYAGINLYKNSGDGRGWALLLTCNDPSCVDLSALPALGVSAAWTYKASYVLGGKEVGTMSLEVAITVLGLT